MAKKIKNDVPGIVKEFLPQAMDVAVQSYRLFLQKKIENWGEHEGFGKNHTAGKAAVAHIEMLLKLSRQVDVTKTESGISVEDIQKLLETAQVEINGYANTYTEEDEDMA